jgi:hypothetical protein
MKKLTVGKLKKKLTKIFNEFIRLRDQDLPCISCGKSFPSYDAGHFFATKGYDGIRFEEDNVHGECVGCNRFNHSHLIGYTERLPNRIGIERYQALKDKALEYKMNGNKFQRYELIELIEIYKEKVNALKNS